MGTAWAQFIEHCCGFSPWHSSGVGGLSAGMLGGAASDLSVYGCILPSSLHPQLSITNISWKLCIIKPLASYREFAFFPTLVAFTERHDMLFCIVFEIRMIKINVHNGDFQGVILPSQRIL